jgi:hypothetical protein
MPHVRYFCRGCPSGKLLAAEDGEPYKLVTPRPSGAATRFGVF